MCGRITNIDLERAILIKHELDKILEIKDGNIGEPQKHIEFEPLPDEMPATEPAAPAVEPEAVPV